VTLRYTDWLNWEINAPLELSPAILGSISLPRTVEIFELELETRNGKKQELYSILKGCETWKLGNRLRSSDPQKEFVQNSFQMSKRTESSWIGSSEPAGDEPYRGYHHTPEMNGTPDLPVEKMMYCIVKLAWTRV
jgi:hypothetical protein